MSFNKFLKCFFSVMVVCMFMLNCSGSMFFSKVLPGPFSVRAEDVVQLTDILEGDGGKIKTINADKLSSATDEFTEVSISSPENLVTRDNSELKFKAEKTVSEQAWKMTISEIQANASTSGQTSSSAGDKSVDVIILAQETTNNRVYYFRQKLQEPSETDGSYSLSINLSEKNLPSGDYRCYAWNETSVDPLTTCEYNEVLGNSESWLCELKAPKIDVKTTNIEPKADYTEKEIIELLGITAKDSDGNDIAIDDIKITNFDASMFAKSENVEIVLRAKDNKDRYGFDKKMITASESSSESDKVEFVDENSGIIIKAPKGLLPDNAKLSAKSILENSFRWKEIYNNIDSNYKQSLEKFSAFDLDFLDDKNEVIDLKDNKTLIDIYIPIPKDFDAEEVYALYVNVLENEKDEYHGESEVWKDPETEKKYCHFQVTHLSPYTINDPITAKDLEEAMNAPKDVKAGYSNLNWLILSGISICSLAAFLFIMSKKEDVILEN